MRIRA